MSPNYHDCMILAKAAKKNKLSVQECKALLVKGGANKMTVQMVCAALYGRNKS